MFELADTVTGVHLFAVKSCQETTVNGEQPTSLNVSTTGFEHNGFRDRGIVIADENHLFISRRGWNEQKTVCYRQDSRLATVATDIQSDHLAVRLPGSGTIEVGHFEPPDSEASQEIMLFGNPFYGFDMGSKLAKEFTTLLKREVRLYWVDTNRPRLIKPKYRRDDACNQAAGADVYPFLLASQVSLDKMHHQAGWPLGTLPLGVYRANIEIKGESLGAFAEDKIRQIRIGDMGAYVVKACARCKIPDYDSETGEWHGLSSKLLKKSRVGWRADEDSEVDQAQSYFGQNLNHKLDSVGQTLAIGDPVLVDEWGEPNVRMKHTASAREMRVK